jgi:hypothetical protein
MIPNDTMINDVVNLKPEIKSDIFSGIRFPMIFFAKLGLTSILVVTFAFGSQCQSMTGLFRLLPVACTPELNNKEKEILIEKGEYIVPGGDSNETVKYSIDTAEVKNYLRCEYSFTTGQRAFVIIEIKKFKKTNGEFILVYSQYGGVPIEVEQREFKIYNIRNGKLIESKEIMIPKDIGLRNVLRQGYSDSLFTKIKNNTNSSFLLNSDKENELEFRISSPLNLDEYKKYMIGNVILFNWDGRSFLKRIIWD